MHRFFSPRSLRAVGFGSLVVMVILLLPSGRNWAGRSGISLNEDLATDPTTLSYFQRNAAVPHIRPLGLSPLGEDFVPNIPPLDRRKGLIYTPVGFFNPKDPRGLDALQIGRAHV